MTHDPNAGQYPPRQPWAPQYDPAAHARRLDQGIAPQDYGQRTWPPPQQAGWQQPPPQYPPPGHRPPPRKRRKGGIIAGIIGGFFLLIIVIAIAANGGSKPGTVTPPAATSGAAGGSPASGPAPAQAAAAATVTYKVTGSPADVTYGPAGSSLSGAVPMRKTDKLGSKPAAYYSIDAQLSGGGKVTCEILVSGKVISTSTATGGYNIASCEITQDPFSGQWQDANAA
jgi:hypothetical protein